MKISKDVVINLVKHVRANTEEEAIETDKGVLSVFYLDDITLTFTQGEKPSFYGIVFDALGRDFTILGDLEILVTIEDDNEEEDAYQIEDPKFVAQLEDYLRWRADTLEKFQI